MKSLRKQRKLKHNVNVVLPWASMRYPKYITPLFTWLFKDTNLFPLWCISNAIYIYNWNQRPLVCLLDAILLKIITVYCIA